MSEEEAIQLALTRADQRIAAASALVEAMAKTQSQMFRQNYADQIDTILASANGYIALAKELSQNPEPENEQ